MHSNMNANGSIPTIAQKTHLTKSSLPASEVAVAVELEAEPGPEAAAVAVAENDAVVSVLLISAVDIVAVEAALVAVNGIFDAML